MGKVPVQWKVQFFVLEATEINEHFQGFYVNFVWIVSETESARIGKQKPPVKTAGEST